MLCAGAGAGADAGAAASSVSPAPAPPAKKRKAHTGKAAAASGKRFAGIHQRCDKKRMSDNDKLSRGTCQYCTTPCSAEYNCAECGIALHQPNSLFNWPCFAKYHSSRSADRKHCYADWRALPNPKEAFENHPDVLAVKVKAHAKQKSPPAGTKSFKVSRPTRATSAAAAAAAAPQ